MNLGTRKICPKGYKKNKTKSDANPYDCVLNPTSKTLKSPRLFSKYVIVKGTATNFRDLIGHLGYDSTANPGYPGRIAKASVTRVIGKIEDELKSNATDINVKLDRDDMNVLKNTIVGSQWLKVLDVVYLKRTSEVTPRKRSPLRPSPTSRKNPRSPKIYSNFYVLTSTLPQFKSLIKNLRANPSGVLDVVAVVSVKRLIRKIQVSVNKGLTTVLIDRDDLFTLENTVEGKKWEGKITGVKRSPVSPVSPPFTMNSSVSPPFTMN